MGETSVRELKSRKSSIEGMKFKNAYAMTIYAEKSTTKNQTQKKDAVFIRSIR